MRFLIFLLSMTQRDGQGNRLVTARKRRPACESGLSAERPCCGCGSAGSGRRESLATSVAQAAFARAAFAEEAAVEAMRRVWEYARTGAVRPPGGRRMPCALQDYLRRDGRSRSGQGRDERGPWAAQDASQPDRELPAQGRAGLAAKAVEEPSDAWAQQLDLAAESRGGERYDQDQKNFEHIRRTSGERNDRVPKWRLFYDEPKCHNAFSTRAAGGRERWDA
jgi:hypothetical protein